MLKGKKIFLTAVERSDLKQLKDWRNNEHFRKHFREYRELNDDMQEQWFNKAVLNDPTTVMFAIRRCSDDRLLGCCGLVYTHWVYRHADLSLYIGDEDAYIDQKGYAQETCQLLLSYAFDNLGLNKVWTEIYVFDKAKKDLYEKAGFSVDGILRENYFYNGRYWDSYILSYLAREWRAKVHG